MKNKTMWVLLGLLVACAVVIGLLKSGLFDEKMLASRQVFSEPPLDVVSVMLQKRDGETIQFKFDGEHWQMIKPGDMPADDALVDNLVRMLRKLEFQRSFDPAQENLDDAQTGLDKPLWTVTLKNAEGKTWALNVGLETPAIGSEAPEVYVRPAGKAKTFVVRGGMSTTLGRPAGDYRRMTIMQFKPDAVEGISLAGREGVELVKRDGVWRITAPTSAPADKMRVSQLLDDLLALKADRMVPGVLTPEVKADYGLDKPRMTLTLNLEGGRTQMLWVGSRLGEDVAVATAAGKSVALLPADKLKSLELSEAMLREKTLLSFDAKDVKSIVIDQKDKPKIILQKTDDVWRFSAPYAHAAEDISVNGFLTRLGQMKASEWIDPKGIAGISSPQASVEMTLEDGKIIALNIGGISDGKRFCQVPGAASVAAVNGDSLSWVGDALYWLWPKTLIDLPKDIQITDIVIDRQDGDYHLAQTPEGWMLQEPTQEKADMPVVNTLLEVLSHLKGLRILSVGKTVPDEYTKLSKSLVVTMTARPGKKAEQDQSVGPPVLHQIRMHVARYDEGRGLTVAWREDQQPMVVYQVSIDLMDILDNPLAAPAKEKHD